MISSEMQIDLINLGIRELVSGSMNVVLDDNICEWEEQMSSLLTEKSYLVAQIKADNDHLAEEAEGDLATIGKKKAKKK